MQVFCDFSRAAVSQGREIEAYSAVIQLHLAIINGGKCFSGDINDIT